MSIPMQQQLFKFQPVLAEGTSCSSIGDWGAPLEQLLTMPMQLQMPMQVQMPMQLPMSMPQSMLTPYGFGIPPTNGGAPRQPLTGCVRPLAPLLGRALHAPTNPAVPCEVRAWP